MAIKLNKVVSKPEEKQMLSFAIRNRMFTSRELKKCTLVCTTHVQLHNILRNFFRSYVMIVLVSTGTHNYICLKALKGP